MKNGFDIITRLNGRAAAVIGPAFALLSLTGQLADGDTVTIDGTTYEADDDASVTAGNVLVDITGNASAADDVDDLVTAILANQGDSFQAIDLGDEVLVLSNQTKPIATAEVATNAVWVNDGSDVVDPQEDIPLPAMQSRAPSAAEVTLGSMVFNFGKAPTAVVIQVRVTATGAIKQWDGAYAAQGTAIVLDNGGTTDWAATDDVTVLATF